MGYIRCENCGGYYELNEGESVEDFEACQCGGKLVYTKEIHAKNDADDDASLERTDSLQKPSSGPSEKVIPEPAPESSPDPASKTTFWTMSNIGMIMMILGFIGLIFAFFFPFLFLWTIPVDSPERFLGLFVQTIWIYMISIIAMFLGLVLFLAVNLNKNKKNIADHAGVVSENLQKLPVGYHVFTNIKLPNFRLKIGLLVVGPTGIFVIESHSLPGYYIIEGDDWWKESESKRVKSLSNPGKQSKSKTMELRKFLNSQDVNIEYVWINPIVSLPSDQYRADKKPHNYDLMNPDEVSDFILNRKSKIDEDMINRVVTVIKRCSK
ncbi:MAG TPA: nuclease-related domain-containing protein [Methanobacteriaceae archaeon]|nr:nuclease-related domain-containing protein [Methanobacteriaceae archaeon]